MSSFGETPRRGGLIRDASAGAWTADEELRRDSGRLFIGPADLVGEAVDRFDPHQVDRAAAEAAAGHARAEHAIDAARRVRPERRSRGN